MNHFTCETLRIKLFENITLDTKIAIFYYKNENCVDTLSFCPNFVNKFFLTNKMISEDNIKDNQNIISYDWYYFSLGKNVTNLKNPELIAVKFNSIFDRFLS